MKRILVSLLCIVITVAVLTVSVIIPVSAADTGVIILSKRTMSTGEDITVTVKYNSDSSLKSVSGYLTFDNKVFKYKSGGAGADKNGVKIDETVTDSNKSRSYQIVFTAIAPATSTFSFSVEGTKSSGVKSKVSQGASVRVIGAAIPANQIITDAPPELKVEFDNQIYYILDSADSVPELPGFTRSVTEYNDIEINTLTDEHGKYTLFYLSDEEATKTYWFYLTDEGELEPLEYIVSNEYIYIVEVPDMTSIPEGNWKPGKYTIPSTAATVDCFESTKSIMSDFYIFLCYYDGVSQFYRYDKKTEVLQRDPGFTLSKPVPIEAEVTSTSFVEYLTNLAYEAKALIFLAFFEVLLVITLVVLVLRRNRAALTQKYN